MTLTKEDLKNAQSTTKVLHYATGLHTVALFLRADGTSQVMEIQRFSSGNYFRSPSPIFTDGLEAERWALACTTSEERERAQQATGVHL
jgi:hypothetical protein